MPALRARLRSEGRVARVHVARHGHADRRDVHRAHRAAAEEPRQLPHRPRRLSDRALRNHAALPQGACHRAQLLQLSVAMAWPRWIWLRALGLIFLSAFYSLAFQIEGLIGPRGILPAGEYLSELRDAVGAAKALWYAPTLFRLGSFDASPLAAAPPGAAPPVLLTPVLAPRAPTLSVSACF